MILLNMVIEQVESFFLDKTNEEKKINLKKYWREYMALKSEIDISFAT